MASKLNSDFIGFVEGVLDDKDKLKNPIEDEFTVLDDKDISKNPFKDELIVYKYKMQNEIKQEVLTEIKSCFLKKGKKYNDIPGELYFHKQDRDSFLYMCPQFIQQRPIRLCSSSYFGVVLEKQKKNTYGDKKVSVGTLLPLWRQYSAVLQLNTKNIFVPYLTNSCTEQTKRVDSKVLDRICKVVSKKWNLNVSQMDALHGIVTRKNKIQLLHGPPGTGKSTTVLATLNALTLGYFKEDNEHKRVLVVAKTNKCLLDLVEKFNSRGNKFFDEGDGKTYQPSLIIFSDNDKIQKSDFSKQRILDRYQRKEIPDLTKLATYIREFKTAWKNVSPFDKYYQFDGRLVDASNYTIKLMEDKLKYFKILKYVQEERNPVNQIVRILESMDIVFCTASGINKHGIRPVKFHHVLMEESSQMSETETLVPLTATGSEDNMKCTLIGDPNQIGCVSINNEYKRTSLLERLINKDNIDTYFLDTQYRFGPTLNHIISDFAYNNKLICGNTKTDHLTFKKNLYPFTGVDKRLRPAILVTHDGGKIKKNIDRSSYNKYEADVVIDIVSRLCNSEVDPTRVVVLTPYTAQCTALEQDRRLDRNTVVETIDTYQGNENEIVIVSMVKVTGFSGNKKRLTVALSRAKYCLIVVGPLDLNNLYPFKDNQTFTYITITSEGFCLKKDYIREESDSVNVKVTLTKFVCPKASNIKKIKTRPKTYCSHQGCMKNKQSKLSMFKLGRKKEKFGSTTTCYVCKESLSRGFKHGAGVLCKLCNTKHKLVGNIDLGQYCSEHATLPPCQLSVYQDFAEKCTNTAQHVYKEDDTQYYLCSTCFPWDVCKGQNCEKLGKHNGYCSKCRQCNRKGCNKRKVGGEEFCTEHKKKKRKGKKKINSIS